MVKGFLTVPGVEGGSPCAALDLRVHAGLSDFFFFFISSFSLTAGLDLDALHVRGGPLGFFPPLLYLLSADRTSS